MNFKINQFVYDSENKEFLKITNGIPIQENDSLGISGREVIPTEGIALRVVSVIDGLPSIGFTYRKINPAAIHAAVDNGLFDEIMEISKPIHFNYIGRV